MCIRDSSAVTRLRAYAGFEPGYKPIADILKQRVIEQMAKPDVIYPSRTEIETELGRDSNYLDGIAALFQKYNPVSYTHLDVYKRQTALRAPARNRFV